MFETQSNPLIAPIAEVRYAFDEQKLKRDWDEAVADGQDAEERKVAVLRAALKQWPMVPHVMPNGAVTGTKRHCPEMRRFVRDVLGMPDSRQGMNNYAARLIAQGLAGIRFYNTRNHAITTQGRKLRRAVIEVTTKYRLGADPQECMETLATYYETLANEQT